MASKDTTSASGHKQKDRKAVDIVEIRRHDGPLMLPAKLALDEAAAALMKEHAAQEQTVRPMATIAAFPWETGLSLVRVLRSKFGLMETITTEGWFGPNHPGAVEVATGVNETTLVPWGAPLAVPGLSGTLEVASDEDSKGMLCSRIIGEIKRKDEPVFREIVDAVRQDIEANNIYRGKVLTLGFTGSQPVLTFVDTSEWDVSKLRWNENIQRPIETRVLGYIRNIDLFRTAGIRNRRGVLGAGGFGTGKSKLGWLITKVAEQANASLTLPWTVVWLEDVNKLEQLLSFGTERWGRLIVVTEDLDRITAGDRDKDMDRLSQVIDGMGNAAAEVLLYCTTNNYDHIHPVFKRDGRFDVRLHMELPNAAAVEQLLWAYGGSLIADDADLSKAAYALRGISPAAVENVVAAAKEAYMVRTGNKNFQLNGDDLAAAAAEVAQQHGFSQRTDTKPRSKEELFGQAVGTGLAEGMAQMAGLVVAHLQRPKLSMEPWEQQHEEGSIGDRLLSAGGD